MTCRRSPCTFSSRVIGRSSQSGPLQGVVTLGTIGQMALTLSGHKCQHYSDSVHPVQTRNGVDTLIVPERQIASDVDCAPEKRGWRLAAKAVAVMRAFVVVETQETVQAPLQGRAAREVTSAEGHTPVFLQDGALQTFH